MLADLHSHYPMHLLAEVPKDCALEGMVRVRERRRWLQKLRAAVLGFAARLLNFRRWSDTWRVSLDGLERGDVRLVFSVLYQPFDEMDLDEWYGSDPEPEYYGNLVAHLRQVEDELAELDPAGERHVIVRRAADLDDARGRVAFVHCVEGGFHLGVTPDEIREHVAELGTLGVRYITLAHLFWRQIATNAPALPFLSDRLYRTIFPQPRGTGLTELGRAAVEAMYDARILVDLSHMRGEAIDETLDLLDELDRRAGAPPGDVPVIASHAGFRWGRQEYMLGPEHVRRIADRDGVIGLILAHHQLDDGIRRRNTTDITGTVEVIRRHVDAIRGVTGSHRHVGIGSDLDGFIKPTMGGVETAADLARLREPLEALYGEEAADILGGNAERVLRRVLA